MKRLIAVLAVAILGGCAMPPTAPTAKEITGADYGPEPENYKELITAYMLNQLKDPDSAKFEFNKPPAKAWFGYGDKIFGWGVCATVNAKNSYGGYTGKQGSYFVIKDGAIVVARHASSLGQNGEQLVDNFCNSL